MPATPFHGPPRADNHRRHVPALNSLKAFIALLGPAIGMARDVEYVIG